LVSPRAVYPPEPPAPVNGTSRKNCRWTGDQLQLTDTFTYPMGTSGGGPTGICVLYDSPSNQTWAVWGGALALAMRLTLIFADGWHVDRSKHASGPPGAAQRQRQPGAARPGLHDRHGRPTRCVLRLAQHDRLCCEQAKVRPRPTHFRPTALSPKTKKQTVARHGSSGAKGTCCVVRSSAAGTPTSEVRARSLASPTVSTIERSPSEPVPCRAA
jgi:hypothetical protein